MKILPPQIFLVVFVGFLSASAAIAQPQPSVSPQQSKPTNTNSIQQDKELDDKIYRLTREEIERLKKDTKEQVELYIKNRVNETMWGYTSIFALIFGGIAGLVLANKWKAEFKKEYLQVIKNEVGLKIETGVQGEFQQCLEKLDFRKQFEEEIEKKFNKELESLKTDLAVQRRKDEIIQELSILIPRPDLFFHEQVKRGTKPMLKSLTMELENLKKSNTNLCLTVEDYIKWGDGIYYLAWDGQPETYNTWFNQDSNLKTPEYAEAFDYYEKAIAQYQEAINLQPHAYYAYLGIGNALRMSGRYDKKRYEEAIKCYKKATQDENISFIAYVNMGLASRRLYDGEQGLREGLKCLDEALAIFPSYARTYYNKACYHARLGEVDDAIINLEEALKKAPEKSIERAEHDDDFCPIKDNEKFQQLIPNYSVNCSVS